MNLLGVLVVNLNRLELTKNCIKDLQNQTNKNFEIHLFDQNSSEEGTSEYLSQVEEQGIIVHRNEYNIPLNHLWNSFKDLCKCPYLCFLNNDVQLSNRFVEDTISTFSHNPSVGITTYVTNHPDHLDTLPNLDFIILKPPTYQGWAFTIKRELMPTIPRDTQLFYGDDIIFSHVVNKGYHIAFVYSAPMVHYCSQTHAEYALNNNVNHRMVLDCEIFWRYARENGLVKLSQTAATGMSRLYPEPGMKIRN
jgi:GT2 family glycosyltransferase